MAGTKEIKRRIKSVKSTKKITKAMELVAASKMKRAVSATLASRLYAEYSSSILTSVAKNIEKISSPLFTEREVKNVLLILITSNRGLCGAYNAQIIKRALFLIKKENENTNIHILTIGKKGDVAMRRINKNIIASFFELPDYVSLRDVVPISKLSIDEFSLGNYDKVLVAYTDFISALNQKPNIKQILPVSKRSLKELIENLGENKNNQEENSKQDRKIDYLVEGDTKDLIASLALKLTRMQIYQMLLESNASEQSSRMMAMKNASEASGEMIDDLTLMFNKARQANITREISEISAGMVTAD
ncbi:ATP synthase F1 subunit gamma [Candidatus Nomurabacteria bacterium RIFOXYB1_FULL_39_16]|uniref:ATP synthase gamma chain n=2 Tax=Candidatus Nomuraibacteriota TaxID=1752729 RepID=A0A0G0QTV9_9BACT|nr:MAG: ATP synthase gamma chain [Candidatus Nomurabacteria bacterium GW2011_GWF2_40_12]OGJ08827.1 MAG: ATP synthase F1 subunit gamma [Candidatus Nomurabacteria bacterium RIFOXYB1_FULL_39_16]OGJ14956.1 MAG: ATP synthase F1 subunit gamma [Candidatus Nomurabacteria bacterium RIFOXYD1_FULL_39_12]